MTANLQRALRLLEDGYPRVQWAEGGSPQGTGLWSFRGDGVGGGGEAVAVAAAAAAAAAQMGCCG